MESTETNIIAPIVDPAPPAPVLMTPKKKINLLPLLGGVAIILVVLAIALSFFSRAKTNTAKPSSTGSAAEGNTASGNTYTNSTYFYTLTLPTNWSEIKHSPLLSNIALFDGDGNATLEITAAKVSPSLDEYLAGQDDTNKNTIKSTKSTQVKVGDYDGYERAESWPIVGLQTIITYVKVQDMLYTFGLIPASGKNAITNDSIMRDYHASLASFHLTDTSQLGKDWKTYESKPVVGLAFKSFTLKYPQTWALTDNSDSKSLALSIYRNNYEITISQKPIGGAVCLFSDSPAFEGSSGDLRSKQYAEFNTASGTILRRYFNANSGDKSSMFFCEKQEGGPYFQTPLTIGGLTYNVPAKYDPDIIHEMDEIVKTISITESQ